MAILYGNGGRAGKRAAAETRYKELKKQGVTYKGYDDGTYDLLDKDGNIMRGENQGISTDSGIFNLGQKDRYMNKQLGRMFASDSQNEKDKAAKKKEGEVGDSEDSAGGTGAGGTGDTKTDPRRTIGFSNTKPLIKKVNPIGTKTGNQKYATMDMPSYDFKDEELPEDLEIIDTKTAPVYNSLEQKALEQARLGGLSYRGGFRADYIRNNPTYQVPGWIEDKDKQRFYEGLIEETKNRLAAPQDDKLKGYVKAYDSYKRSLDGNVGMRQLSIEDFISGADNRIRSSYDRQFKRENEATAAEKKKEYENSPEAKRIRENIAKRYGTNKMGPAALMRDGGKVKLKSKNR